LRLTDNIFLAKSPFVRADKVQGGFRTVANVVVNGELFLGSLIINVAEFD